MEPFPHTYKVRAAGASEGDLALAAQGLPDLTLAAPREFDGPGNRWSPESMLCGAVASCFILTFRAVAKASKFSWRTLDCEVQGTLERREGITQFTHFAVSAVLVMESAAEQVLAQRLLEKAEHGCLVANSLKAGRSLTTDIREANRPVSTSTD